MEELMRLDVEDGTGLCMWIKRSPGIRWPQTISHQINLYHRKSDDKVACVAGGIRERASGGRAAIT